LSDDSASFNEHYKQAADVYKNADVSAEPERIPAADFSSFVSSG